MDARAWADVAEAAGRSCAACAGLGLRESARLLGGDGLLGALAPEPLGLGLPPGAARAVVEAGGRALLPFRLADALAGAALLARMRPEAAAAVIAGEAVLAIAPASTLRAGADGRFTGAAGAVAWGAEADWALAPVALEGGGAGVALFARGALAPGPAGGLDPACPRVALRARAGGAQATAVLAPGAEADAFGALALALASADMLAAAGAALERAVAHVSARAQFGRPLVGFQAIRHALARARMTLENGARLLEGALAPDAGPAEAALAYAYARTHAPAAAELALHLHGGMGFTWDAGAHLYVRRLRADAAARPVPDTLADALT